MKTKATAKPSKSKSTKAPAKAVQAPAPAPAPVTIKKEEKSLALAAIVPSPDNRTVTPDELDKDFLDSVQQWGILNRLWVYPLAQDDKRRKKGATHELIAGERRWCAAGLVALKEAPVTIFHCTAKQADELRLIENLQRLDLTELEEGHSYRNLRDKHGYVVLDEKHPERSLVHVLNKSENYIFGRIKLVEAPKIVTEAVQAGKLSPSVALRVARISDPKAQVEAAKEFANYETFHGGAVTDKIAAEIIEEKFQRQLKGAPFETKDATLVPVETDDKKHRTAGGACTDCPMRSGNQKELPGTGKSRGDMCLNPGCYSRKTEATWQREKDAHKKTHVFVPDEETRSIFTGWNADVHGERLGENSRYVYPHDKCPDDPKHRTWQILIGEPHPVSVGRYLVRGPRTGKALTLFVRAECKAAIIAAGVHNFYAAKSADTKAETVEDLLDARFSVLEEQETEWRLAYVIDAIAQREMLPEAVLPGAVFSCMLGALTTSQGYNIPESCTAATIRRWTPIREGLQPSAIAPNFVAQLPASRSFAFILEAALRRFIPFGGIETLNEALEEIATACKIDVDAAWNKHCGRLEMLRKAREPFYVLTTYHDLQRIADAYSPDRIIDGRPIKSALFEGRHYTVTGTQSVGQATEKVFAWEIVPRKAYEKDGHKAVTYKASSTIPTGSKAPFTYEGILVTQKGIEYCLAGPERIFFVRPGQCRKCGAVEEFGKEPLTWADADHTVCDKCECKIGKAAK